MRVLCVGNLYPPHALGGGYELTFQSSVRDLRARGHEVRVLTTNVFDDDVGERAEEDRNRALQRLSTCGAENTALRQQLRLLQKILESQAEVSGLEVLAGE